MKILSWIFSLGFSLSLAACGGGGDGAPSLNLNQVGQVETAATGDTVVVAFTSVDCPKLSGTQTCAQVGALKTLSFVSGVPLTNAWVFQDNQFVNGTFITNGTTWTFTPDVPMAFTAPGTIEVDGVVSLSATVGQSANIALHATGAADTVVSLTGGVTTLVVNRLAIFGSIPNATSATFAQVKAYGEAGWFDFVCPVEAEGGCAVTLYESLRGTDIPVGTQVDTYVTTTEGTFWWYGLQTSGAVIQGWETFNLSSPIVVPAGTTATFVVKTTTASGQLGVGVTASVVNTGQVIRIMSAPCPSLVCMKG